MFGKILRAGKGGHGLKYKMDVQVVQLENLPPTIKKCRVVWARSAKLQMTDIKDVRGSVASFKQTLTQVSTIYKDKSGKYEPKEYEFKVQIPGKSSSDTPVTIGKNVVDMSKYCREETTTQPAMVPITFKIVGTSTTSYLKLSITTVFLGDSNEDGGTEVSGLTGMTSDHGSVREQDLEGFGDEEHSKFSKKARSNKREDPANTVGGTSGRNNNTRAESTRRHKPLPPTAEEDDSDLEDKPEPASATVKSSRRKSSARSSEIEAAEGTDDNPFTKKVAKPTLRKVPPKVWDDDEDVSPMNSDISDTEPPKLSAKLKKVEEPEEPFDDMKASLFSTKKAAASGRTSGGASASAASTAVPSVKGVGIKSSKIPAPPPVEDVDDESLRNDLFSAKPKSSAAGLSSKPRVGAATGGAAIAATAGAVASAPASGKQKSRITPPPVTRDEEENDDEDDPGPSTSAAQRAAAAARSRSKALEPSEAPTTKGSSLSGSGSKPDSSKGVSAAELEQLRQRVAQLEKQLEDERVAKDDMNKKMQKYADKVADLEDQLAEGNVTELYAQMKEMEAKYQAEIKDMEAKYQVEISELMERHLAEVSELEEMHQAEIKEVHEAASGSRRPRGGVSLEEVERLRAEVAEQDSLLKARTAKLESDQVAANAARQAAEAKLADANKMIDDSLLVATKHQQENKALQDEIARLKRQLEEVLSWDTGAAVAAVTAAANNGRRGSQAEAELEELRERIENLEEENARLQKLVSSRGRASRILSDSEDKKRLEELQAANRKLEAVCDDLEEKAHIAQEKAESLQAELETAKEKIRGLEAAASALQKRMEDEMANAGGRQPKDKVADLEARVSRLAREKATLAEQLEEERATRKELEETLKDKLDRAGDDEAAETVAAFEVKYNRLKERYKMLEESSQEELDELQDQLTEALSQVTDLQRQVKQLQSQGTQGRLSGAAINTANDELRNLRSENERLVQQLVSKTMELAELNETEITIKRELARLQEVNRKLAQKATTLEAQAAVAHAGKPQKGKK